MLDFLNSFFIGPMLPLVVLGSGIIMAFRLKWFYLLHPVKLIRGMLSSSKKNGESSFKSVTLALAGTLGVGNIVGVSSAIIYGGAGAIFWMWVGAIISMSLKYSEILLAVLYRKTRSTQKTDGYYGGAMYYMRDALPGKGINKKIAAFLGGVFAVFCIINSLSTGTAIQINAISGAMREVFSLSPRSCAVLLIVLVAVSLAVGTKNISSITVVLIPIMTVIYILISMYIIISNIVLLPEIFSNIIKSAFSFESIGGGAVGLGISGAIRYGISRGIISNEAGCGTAPTAHARANAKSPVQQGFWGIFEVFVDTILLCTMTAFVVLIFVSKSDASALDSMGLTLMSYQSGMGDISLYLIGISVFVFAYATVLCQYYYGVESLSYITENKNAVIVYTLVFFAAIVYGAVSADESVWQITDLSVGIMTFINVSVLLLLNRQVVTETNRYFPKDRKNK